MTRVFQNSWFRKFVRKQKIDDQGLCDAVSRMERGLVDADLGGGLFKQRVPRRGAGKSGGYRTLVAFKTKTRAVFVFGFAKNEKDNIDQDDERDLKALAKLVLGLTELEMDRLVEAGKFDEVRCAEQANHENIS